MSESAQIQKNLPQTSQKQNPNNEENDAQSSQQYQLHDYDVENDQYDPEEETYLERLREQRKRIQDLSLNVENYREKYEEQARRSKLLEAQLSKYQNSKISSIRYEQISIQYSTVQAQNTELRESIQELKIENMDLISELGSLKARLEKEFNSQKKKDLAKIQDYIERLGDKQEQIDKLQKELRKKDKEISDLNSSFSFKLKKIQQQHEEQIINGQKKIESYEKSQQHNQINLLQQNLTDAQRQINRLKQQNFGLKSQLEDQQRDFEIESDKWKSNTKKLKKKLDDKEKECDQIRFNLQKIERERKDSSSEKKEILNQSTKIRQEFNTKIITIQNGFNNERRAMKTTIDKHQKTIQALMQLKRQNLDRIKELQIILKRKQETAKHRRSMLKHQMKQLDKLQKVIDRIVQ